MHDIQSNEKEWLKELKVLKEEIKNSLALCQCSMLVTW